MGGGKIENGLIFSAGMSCENYFSLEKASGDVFFTGEGLLKFIFLSREAFLNLFFPGGGFDFFSLYKPIKNLPKFFFLSHEIFFLDLFFPEEDLLRFILSLGFFFSISSTPPDD